MKRKKDLDYAKWLGMYYLSSRMHSKYEILEKLRKKEVPEEFCTAAIEYFEQEGYINDFDYATRYIKDASRLKRHGETRIKQFLRNKRITSEVIERAFAEADIDFGDGLEQAILAKARNLDLNDRKDRDKLIRHLVYRGFRLNEIFSKINEVQSSYGHSSNC
jgi:regulatory protein